MTDMQELRRYIAKSIAEFQKNHNVRDPLLFLILLDVSGSMNALVGKSGKRRIDLLKKAVLVFADALCCSTEFAPYRQRAQLAIASYSQDFNLLVPFCSAEQEVLDFQLTAQGITNSGTALAEALDYIEMQKAALSSTGNVRSLVLWLSDGNTSEQDLPNLQNVISREKNKITILPFAIGSDAGVNMEELQSVSNARNHQIVVMEKAKADVFNVLPNILMASSVSFSKRHANGELDLSPLRLPSGVQIQMFSGVL